MQSKLKALLFEKKYPQYRLAKDLGITPKSISKKMYGEVDFTYTEVFRICKILSIQNPLEIFEPFERKKSEMR